MICCLCFRDVSNITMHHLVPKTRHKNKKNKKLYSRREVIEKAPTCEPCHNNVHMVLSEKELARNYNTIEKLREHPDIKKFTNWIKNKPEGVRIPFTPKRKV